MTESQSKHFTGNGQETVWVHISAFGVFFRLNHDGDLEYQHAMKDGTMEPIDEEDGPNVPDDYASDPIKASDKVVANYLRDPDAPENAIVKAFIEDPNALGEEALGMLPIICDECHAHFGDQCEHI